MWEILISRFQEYSWLNDNHVFFHLIWLLLFVEQVNHLKSVCMYIHILIGIVYMYTYINIYYKVNFSVFCSCFSSINYIYFSSCFSNLLQMIKTGIPFMRNNNKVHVLAKYILCGLSRSCCTKKDALIKSLFYFLIFL